MPRRRALTLLEVLLVLCLMVILGAIAWPVLDRPWAEQRLRKSADVVRLAWARARVDAMTTGKTYVFRYEPQTSQFVVEAWQGAEADAESRPGEWFGQASTDAAEPGLFSAVTQNLPEGVQFAIGQSQLDQRAAFVLSTFTDEAAQQGVWSDPVLFYPDGTATSADVRLVNEHGRRIDLSLRGLTGVVTVGETGSLEEVVP
ncbi:MAG: hypothetical protein JW809_19045 [Pirellulales bacterium]|nr:hypothetical protein [Pirellulales bacterium]